MKPSQTAEIQLPPTHLTPAVSYARRTGALSADAPYLLMDIVSLAYREGFCWMANARLAWQSGMVSVPTLQRLLRELTRGGWIEIETAENLNGSLRKIRPNLEKIKATPPPMILPAHFLGGSDSGPPLSEDPPAKTQRTRKRDDDAMPPVAKKEPHKRNRSVKTSAAPPSKSLKGKAAKSNSQKAAKLPRTRSEPEPDRKQRLNLRSSAQSVLQPDNPTTPDDVRCASLLHDAIVKAGPKLHRMNPNRPLKFEAWASDFCKLRDIDEMPQSRIESALKVYCKNITDEYAPQAWSGKSFRAKFAAIEGFTKRRVTSAPTEVTEAESNDPDVIEIASWDWPVPVLMPTLVKSVKITRAFGKRLREVCQGMTGQDVYLDFLIQAILNHRSDAFTLLWYKEALASIPDWKSWSGSMKMFEASPANPQFRKWVLQLSKQRTNKHDVGKRFLREFEERMA